MEEIFTQERMDRITKQLGDFDGGVYILWCKENVFRILKEFYKDSEFTIENMERDSDKIAEFMIDEFEKWCESN